MDDMSVCVVLGKDCDGCVLYSPKPNDSELRLTPAPPPPLLPSSLCSFYIFSL